MEKMIGRHIPRGPGGKHCTCCGEAPPHRDAYRRVQKRALQREWATEVAEDLENIQYKVRVRG